MLANLLASPLLVTLMWDVVSHKVLLIWLAIVFTCCSLTYIYYLYLKPAYKSLATIPEQPIYYILPLIFGVIWGAAGYFFFPPGSMIHTAYLIIFLFGMSSGAVNALSSLWLSYIFLAAPTLLPLTFRLYQQDYIHHTLLGFTILAFFSVMLVISKMTHNSIGESLKIRYENINLVKKLQKQTEDAKKANNDKSRFLAAASHDLRQPIHSLSLLTSAISPEIESDRGKEILSQITNANDAMLSLLHSLLDISKLDAGVVKPEIKLLDLQDIFSSLINEFQPIADKNGLILHHRSCPTIVKSDSVLLKTIIGNLLQNAIRYTKEGKVLLACRKRNNEIQIQIWDTGKGIAKDQQELIFAEYQQLHNPERDQNKGLGLGLSICRRLAKLLNIKLTLKSLVGKGSVFTLKLPLLSEEESNSFKKSRKVSNSLPIGQKSPLNGAVILVIDDNKAILSAMSSLLENWGCHTLTADSIEATVKIAKSNPKRVTAILADYRLRENTTGVEAIDAFNNAVDYQVAGILITGDTSPDRLQEAASHGFPILHKPIKEPHLKSVISRLIRMSA